MLPPAAAHAHAFSHLGHPRVTGLVSMSFVCAHTGQYDGFGVLASSAFKAVCDSKGIATGEQEWESVRSKMAVMKVCGRV